MATSFVGIGERGFWCPDSLLEVWAHLMWELLRGEEAPGIGEYRDSLHLLATGGFHGCMELNLDRLNAETREVLVRYSERLPEVVTAHPDLLKARHLNALGLSGGHGEFLRDIPVEYIRTLTHLIIRLVRGELPWGVGDDEALPVHWLPK